MIVAHGRMPRYVKSNWAPMALGGSLTLLVLAIVFGGEAAVSTTSFCLSCHSMSYPSAELRKSTHYAALGADPACKDCHIPQGLENFGLVLQTHLVEGTRELALELTQDYSDIGRFNARRLEMAHHARMNLKRWDSITCRACHRDPRPPGATARNEHAKMKTQGKTCIDCHQNLVHKEVDETDLDSSLAQGKMVVREE
jgi:cytochrome c-type protein NapC